MSRQPRTALAFFLCLILSLCLLPSAFAGTDGGAEENGTPVSDTAGSAPLVTFLCDDEPEALRALSVYDAEGRLCPPLADAAGEPRYGSFQLAPGEYRYLFHDEEGCYEDLEAAFTVRENIFAYYFSLHLRPVRELYSFSFTYINPIYAGVVDEADIPPVSVSEEEQIEELLAIADELDGVKSRSAARFYAESGIRHTSVADAGAELKEQIMAFEETATIRLLLDSQPTAADWQSYLKEVFAVAIAHNGLPTEGDYLRYEYGGYTADGKILAYGKKYICLFNFSLLHFTNADQEDVLTEEVDRVLASLALNGKSDYEKIRAIYDYLCANTAYGGTGNTKYTAYGALIDHLCICQGYSAALYRLCLASGIDARIITRVYSNDDPRNHSWNIVRLGGQYYELDATWDHDNYGKNYLNFLKGSTYWMTATSHQTLGDEFSDSAFSARYPLPEYSYVSYDTPALEDSITGLDDKLVSLSAATPGIERFRVSLVVDPAESDLEGIHAFDVYPRVAAYSGDTVLAQETVNNAQLSDEARFSVNLPVPESWAEYQLFYTLSRDDHDLASGTADIVCTDGIYTTALNELPQFGHISLALPYELSFDTDGGSETAPQTVPCGKTATEPAPPVKADFWFGGWFADSACTAAFDFENTPIATDTTLYAGWIIPDLVLPAALTVIGEEAFAGGAFCFAALPENCETIGRRSFADCPNLAHVYIPESVLTIDAEAFGGSTALTVFGKAESPAAQFAEEQHLRFIPVS